MVLFSFLILPTEPYPLGWDGWERVGQPSKVAGTKLARVVCESRVLARACWFFWHKVSVEFEPCTQFLAELDGLALASCSVRGTIVSNK